MLRPAQLAMVLALAACSAEATDPQPSPAAQAPCPDAGPAPDACEVCLGCCLTDARGLRSCLPSELTSDKACGYHGAACEACKPGVACGFFGCGKTGN